MSPSPQSSPHTPSLSPQVINESLSGMQALVEGMSSAVHSQLDWVIGQLGGANRGLRYIIYTHIHRHYVWLSCRALTSCAGHALFLLVSMLLVVFLRVPTPARVFLLVAVVINTVLDIKTGMALTFTALATMATIVAVCELYITAILPLVPAHSVLCSELGLCQCPEISLHTPTSLLPHLTTTPSTSLLTPSHCSPFSIPPP